MDDISDSERVSEEEIRTYVDRFNNWERWGSSSHLGTMNFVTQAKRVEAASLISDGRSISCSRPIDPHADPGVLHFMIRPGGDVSKNGQGGTIDWLGMRLHSHNTHIDALCHQSWNGVIYGGTTVADSVPASGARVGGMDDLSQGIFTRGVLLDVPQVRGVAGLAPGTAITRADLEACEAAQHVQVRSGDALIVRTGMEQVSDSPIADPMAGVDADVIPYLFEREIAMLASDLSNDVHPETNPYKSFYFPVHMVGIVAMGLWIVDYMDLEALAATCKELDRWEFAFVLAPLCIVGGTGSPANPLALF